MLLAALFATVSEPLSLKTETVAGFKVRVIRADLASPRIKVGVVLAQGFPGADESFASMIKRNSPAAVINGAYFDKFTKLPIGDIVTGGQVRHSGRMGTALTLTPEQTPDLLRVVRHKTYAWGTYETVLACGPALVLDGKVNVDAGGEGFRSAAIQGKIARMGVGYSQDRVLFLVQFLSKATFDDMAKVFLGLGCFEAMNLDAGASLGMAWRGKILTQPQRKLTNLLAVWDQEPS